MKRLTLALTAATLLSTLPASATHFRFGTLTWNARPDLGANVVEFELTASFRRSGYPGSAPDGQPTIGDVISETIGATSLFPGDGSTLGSPLQFEVIAVDPIQDWILARAELPDPGAPDKVLLHTYPSANDGGEPWVAFIQSCCRISPPNHINNPNGEYRVETLVDLDFGNEPPITLSAPIVSCELGDLCQFFVPAIDNDGDELRWRLADNFEAAGGSSFVQPGPPYAPNALSVDEETGLVMWDTTGATVGGNGFGLYSTQIIVEDVLPTGEIIGKTAVDFFVRVAPVPPNAPEFVSPPTPPSGSTLTIGVDQTLTIQLQASDEDPGDAITLSDLGLPAGMTCDYGVPGSPVSGTCEWTPDVSQIGSYIAIFTATDSFGLGAAPLALQIEVTETDCQSVEVEPGVAFGHGWGMAFEISEDDGMVLRNIRLGTRKMAEQISLPYVFVEFDAAPFQGERYELRTDCADEPGRSRLMSFTRNVNSRRLLLEAKYKIDQLGANEASSVVVTQSYEFRKARPAGGCEPSQEDTTLPVNPPRSGEEFPCNPFKFKVTYDFTGGAGETLRFIDVPQRMHFRPDDSRSNATTLFRDADSIFDAPFSVIDARENVDNEVAYYMIVGGTENTATFDNLHMTSGGTVRAPSSFPAAAGCPECVHIHWRWSDLIENPDFGLGDPLIPRTDIDFDDQSFSYNSNQDLIVGVTRKEAGDEDPERWFDFLDGDRTKHGDVVMWYVGTGYLDLDSFFVHPGFFSTGYVDLVLEIEPENDPILVGVNDDPVTYNVTVRNNGPGVADNIEVFFDMGNASFRDDSDDRCDGVLTSASCELGRLGSNRSLTFELVVDPLSPGGSFPFSIRISGSASADEVEFNDDDNSTDTFTDVVLPIDLVLLDDGSDTSGTVGEEVKYRYHLRNFSGATAQDVSVTIETPSHGPITDWSVLGSGNCTLAPDSTELTCDFGAVSIETFVFFDVTVVPTSPATLFVEATATSSTPELALDDNELRIRTTVRRN